MQAREDSTLAANETKTVHKFELAGLGKAPFRFIGVEEKVYIAYSGAPAQPAGTCDYCGMGIKYVFRCESADKKVFGVGCDCIQKHGDRGLIKLISSAEKAIRDARNAKAKERKIAKLAARVEKAKEKLPTIQGKLASLPHPNQYFASQGRTLLDYVNWCFENRAADKACVIIETN